MPLVLAFVFVGAVLLLFAHPASAAPPLDDPDSRITSVRFPKNDFIFYTAGDKVLVSVNVINEGDVDTEHDVWIVIGDSFGNAVYDSRAVNDVKTATLVPGRAVTLFFSWTVGEDVPSGAYTIAGYVGSALNPDEPLDEERLAFEISQKPKLTLSRASWNFGEINPEETPFKSFKVSNANPDEGELVWQVDSWPGWIDILVPQEPRVSQIGSGSIQVQVRGAKPVGQLEGVIEVSSNGGTEEIAVAAFVEGTQDGAITRLEVEFTEYRQTQDVEIKLEFSNDGNVTTNFLPVILIEGAVGSYVYNSSEAGENVPVSVGAGRNGSVTFVWTIPYDAAKGEYSVSAELRNADDFDILFDSSTDAQSKFFLVKQGPKLSIEPESWDFGTIMQGDASARAFRVSNSGRLRIFWQVNAWPQWIQIDKTKPVVGPGAFVAEISEFAQPGEFSDVIEVTTNAGPGIIRVYANILAQPTPTPTRTRVPTPTRTPRPANTVLAGVPSPQSTPTRTPGRIAIASRTPSPSPTATPLIFLPTSTPRPTQVPTVRPTATPRPALSALRTTRTPGPVQTPRPSSTPIKIIVVDKPTSVGICGFSPYPPNALAGAANLVFLLGPAVMTAGYRRWRRRRFCC